MTPFLQGVTSKQKDHNRPICPYRPTQRHALSNKQSWDAELRKEAEGRKEENEQLANI